MTSLILPIIVFVVVFVVLTIFQLVIVSINTRHAHGRKPPKNTDSS